MKPKLGIEMTDLHAAIQNLKSLDTYIGGFPVKKQPAGFEHLGCKSFSYLLRLPFFDSENDDTTISHRVVWQGSESTWAKSPGDADGIVRAHEFCIVLEATLQKDRKQWSQEFAPCVNHYDACLAELGLSNVNCYLLLLLTDLNDYTYTSIKQKTKEKCRFVLLTIPMLADVLETYALAFAATHSDLRLLLEDLLYCCERSEDKADFLLRADNAIKHWRTDLLDKERRIFVGARSYRALHKLGGVGSLSEILSCLYDDSIVTEYFDILGRRLITTDIEVSLDEERLAYKAQSVPGDKIYVPMPFSDVKGRVKVLIKELENAATG
jgi:hypothetical protein